MNYFDYMDGLEAFQDTNCLAVQLDRAHKAMSAKYQFERDMKEMEERIYQRVLARIDVDIKNDATQALQDLNRELHNLGK